MHLTVKLIRKTVVGTHLTGLGNLTTPMDYKFQLLGNSKVSIATKVRTDCTSKPLERGSQFTNRNIQV